MSVKHYDLYRLSDPEELEFLGLRDHVAADSLCFFEWPERGGGLLPDPRLDIRLAYAGGGGVDDARRVRCAGSGSVVREVLGRARRDVPM